jgi:HK97 family phage major capsid protein
MTLPQTPEPYQPLSLGEMPGRLKWLFDEAEAATQREWDTQENYDQYMNDLLLEAGQLEETIYGLGDISKTLRFLDDLSEAEQQQVQEKQDEVGKWNDVSEYFRAVWRASNPTFNHLKKDERLIWWDEDKGPMSVKDMAEATGAAGGFLVPIEFRDELFALAPEPNMFLNRVTRIPMATRQVAFPSLDQTDTTAGIPHWFGGLQVYRQAEASEKTLSDAEFREIDLVAHEIIAYARVSNALLADSIISLSAFFNGPLGFRGAILHRMETECFQGNGVGQFQGIINAPATITVPRNTAGTIVYQDLLQMLENFYPVGGQGTWYVTQSGLAELAQIAGPAGNPSYIWNMDAITGLPGRLLGMPIVFTEKLPRIGQAGDIVLANPPFYLWGDREAITVDSSTEERFRNNQTAFRAVARNDGKPWLSAPFTLMDGTSQISPFVILGAGGS